MDVTQKPIWRAMRHIAAIETKVAPPTFTTWIVRSTCWGNCGQPRVTRAPHRPPWRLPCGEPVCRRANKGRPNLLHCEMQRSCGRAAQGRYVTAFGKCNHRRICAATGSAQGAKGVHRGIEERRGLRTCSLWRISTRFSAWQTSSRITGWNKKAEVGSLLRAWARIVTRTADQPQTPWRATA